MRQAHQKIRKTFVKGNEDMSRLLEELKDQSWSRLQWMVLELNGKVWISMKLGQIELAEGIRKKKGNQTKLHQIFKYSV